MKKDTRRRLETFEMWWYRRMQKLSPKGRTKKYSDAPGRLECLCKL